ncbi:Signal transducer regulating beta-lactamase production, contains metallopeptidase domain [Bizionia echini]|uniref:Signal transducer regulating beta-lactamase production, contains metallopeptidase domain n=1 Tax=Bizionia echini TaxID=649333 RepID=A0A1I5CLS8_9FLAO|nr:M56 family metallopeptidase [Bizionia echini]SFN87959.1 Signal transducer regulating beta-lactamase production, contains metallopeptidase domain [Bizionia echini]
MDYFLKASAILTIFYLGYKWFLQLETFFNGNRWFLLSGQLIALLLPLVVIPIYVKVEPQSFNALMFSKTAISQQITANSFNLKTLLLGLYSLGVLFFTGKFIVNLLSLIRVIKHRHSKKIAGIYYIETKDAVAPFSFFNRIVFNPNIYKPYELQLILNHERVHVKQHHSLDILISELTCIILWFNPLVWYYKKALQQNLEFIADHQTQLQSDCKKSYQRLLLKTSIPTNQLEMANNFYNSLIKKRIVMLHTSKSKTLQAWKYAFVIPVLALFLMSFNTKEVYISTTSFETNNSFQRFTVTETSTPSELATIETYFSNKNVKLKFSDISRNTDNTIREITIKTKHNQGTKFTKRVTVKNDNQETIKPFSLMLTENEQDIMFQFSDDETTLVSKDRIMFGKTATTQIGNKKTISDEDGLGNDPLYIINGEHYKKSNLKHQNYTISEHITIINKNEGLERYGEAGKDGVIIFEGETFFDSQDSKPVNKNPSTTESRALILLNGKEITPEKMNQIDPNTIIKTDVINDKSLLEKYGKKGQDGVIIISTGETNTKLMDIPETTLILINGVESTRRDLQAIDPSNIENVNVLKPEIAKSLYNEKGKNGAIIVTTKIRK